MVCHGHGGLIREQTKLRAGFATASEPSSFPELSVDHRGHNIPVGVSQRLLECVARVAEEVVAETIMRCERGIDLATINVVVVRILVYSRNLPPTRLSIRLALSDVEQAPQSWTNKSTLVTNCDDRRYRGE